MAKNPHAQADKIYHDMLDLLEELTALYADEDENAEEEEETEKLDSEELIDAIVEEAAERGIDEESAERVFKGIVALAKKSAEG